MSIIAKNITASGIELQDLAGVYIDAFSEVDLVEFFTLDRVDSSTDLYEAIEAGIIILNDGARDLTKEESLQHSAIPTDYEIPRRFLDLYDTPNTFSGIEYVFLKVNEEKTGVEFTPIMFQDLDDVPTYSGSENRIPRINSSAGGIEFVTVEEIFGNFGLEHSSASEDTESSTNSTSYIQKIRLNLSGIENGRYRIGWYYEWSMSNSAFRFDGKVELDGSSILGVLFERPACGYSWSEGSGFSYQDLTAGDHYVDIYYRSSHFSKAASIRRARLEVWRVS